MLHRIAQAGLTRSNPIGVLLAAPIVAAAVPSMPLRAQTDGIRSDGLVRD